MTREEVKQALEKIKELAQAIAIEALKEEEKPKRWKPENEEDYWYINSYGGADVSFWVDSDVDQGRYKWGNCFRTEEEARYAAECELVEAELQNYADEHNSHEIVWNGYDTNVYLYYDHTDATIRARGIWREHHKDVYFTSYEIALNAIKEIGEERLKKYYFKVVEA